MNGQKLGKKKVIWIVSAIVLAGLALTVYFLQGRWERRFGSKGHFSADTYLESGTGSYDFSKKTRIQYTYVVEAGGMCFELTDEQGNVVYEMEITESCNGYITFENEKPVTLYFHEYALSEDTVVHSEWHTEKKINNFLNFLRLLNNWCNYRLFGPDFLCD